METLPLAADAAAYEFSVVALFMEADWIVKAVMIGLALASVWCWAVIFNRLGVYASVKRATKLFEKSFAETSSLTDLHASFATSQIGVAPVFVAAMDEWQKSAGLQSARDGIKSRIEMALDLAVSEQSEVLAQRLGVLATVGSAAPFIGLFGTVWGIMNAFTAIASSSDTSLAVVAPGIAEALFATALGLVAAIPAVIAYNKLSSDAASLTGRFEGFADRLSALISRKLDAGEMV